MKISKLLIFSRRAASMPARRSLCVDLNSLFII